MSNKAIIVNVAHGNEPYILGVALAKKVAELGGQELDIVVPYLYPGRQETILREDFGDDGNIFLDEELGKIMKPMMFRDQNFSGHLGDLLEHNETAQSQAQARINGRFSSVSLTGQEQEFSRDDIVMEISAGSTIRFGIEPNFFAFCFYHSDIWRATLDAGGMGFDRDKLRKSSDMLQRIEEGYTNAFITEPNTFSGIEFVAKSAVPVPPFKQRTPDSTELEPSIYLMLSGTGSVIDDLLVQAEGLGLRVYYSPFVSSSVKNEKYVAMPTDVLGNDNVRAVFHRGGFGTSWKALANRRPQLLLPYQPNDDPEIAFDIATYEALGIGIEYTGQPGAIKQALQLGPRIENFMEGIMNRFGTEDGLTYTAEKIVLEAGL
jgi:hypothetical protein